MNKLSEEEIIENYNSILNNAKANWIYEDYEILLNFLDLYQKEKEKNMKMISENIYLKEELRKTNRYSLQIDELRNQNAELRDELDEKNAELNKEKEKNDRLAKDNLDLDRFYRRTASHLHERGKDELADYMLAQIGAVPTWTDFEDYSNWVSKDKIKAKIDEIQNRKMKDGECELALHGFQREAKIQVLQELLEEEE